MKEEEKEEVDPHVKEAVQALELGLDEYVICVKVKELHHGLASQSIYICETSPFAMTGLLLSKYVIRFMGILGIVLYFLLDSIPSYYIIFVFFLFGMRFLIFEFSFKVLNRDIKRNSEFLEEESSDPQEGES